ncbi:MAG: GH116 family glycosyl hydrolase [Gemmatimonadota bacterium]
MSAPRFVSWLLLATALLGPRQASAQAAGAYQPTLLGWVAGPFALRGPARPGGYLGVEGRKAAAFGTEVGDFEVWAWPLRILRGFELSFQTPMYAEPVRGRDVARAVEVTPAGATITYVHPAFTVRQRIFAPVSEPALAMVLEVEAIRPMEIIAQFRSDLQLAWPGGIGGQYISWNDELKAFLISESRRQYSAFVGSPFATRATTHPAHALPDAPSEIRIAVGDQTPVPMPRPGEPAGRLVNVVSRGIPIVIVGQIAPRDTVVATYRRVLANLPRLYAERVAHADTLLSSLLGVDDPRVDAVVRWAELNLDEALVCNPDLGCGPVAGYAAAGPGGYRPGFGWFFGGDAAINSLALASVGAFDLARQYLAFFTRYQRADGKITHEISQAAGRVRWFEDYPYAYYHGDTTPFWVLAIGELFRASADTAFLRSVWPNVQRAYQWCLTTDADGDGLMDNSRAGAGAIEVGDLGVGVKSDIYLASVWVEGLRRMEELAGAVGDTAIAADAARRFPVARRTLEERFWMPRANRFAFAILEGDSLNDNLTVWPATAMSWRLFDDVRGQQMSSALARAAISTDWGGRALASESDLYDPLHYNNGTVWPFVTGFLALAQYRYHNVYAAREQLEAIWRTGSLWGLGRNPEVFSGAAYEPLETAVPQQFFATSMALTPYVRGALGLEADAPRGVLALAPRLFDQPGTVGVRHIRVGAAVLDATFTVSDTAFRATVRRVRGGSALTLRFEPSLAPGARVQSVTAGGRAVPYRTTSNGRAVLVAFEVPLGEGADVQVRHSGGWRLDPGGTPPDRGDRSRRLKVLDARVDDGTFVATLEGRAGVSYEITIVRPGGRVSRETVEFPGGGDPRDGYVRKVLRFRP